MKKIIYLVLILSISLCCGSRKEKVERYMEDGIEVVVNHSEPYKIERESTTILRKNSRLIRKEKKSQRQD